MPIIEGIEKKNAEEVLKLMNDMPYSPETIRLEVAKTALQARIADQLHNAIANATEGFIRMTGELTRKTNELKSSFDVFRQSSERASKALNFFTAVIGGAAVLPLILFTIHR